VFAWVAPHRGFELPTGDLVHGDLNPDNVLLDGDRISALIDVEAVGRGSRMHDLATLLVYATLWDGEPGADDDLLATPDATRHPASSRSAWPPACSTCSGSWSATTRRTWIDTSGRRPNCSADCHDYRSTLRFCYRGS
jgi:aminoglycoside phosphotransferase (APT) family kinase protein